ncbi:DUF6010 family protein [Croceiramulus getboli]|nr:hypothetical protein P8624_01925 [Flavobacteriaceae bacterium YJPT1-3]
MITPFLIGLVLSLGIALLIELLRLDKKLMGALTLTAITFIYMGFVALQFPEFWVEMIGALTFLMLAYLGLSKKPLLIPLGLFLHGLWDAGHLFWESTSFLPQGYEPFCIGVDIPLAVYFLIQREQ